MGIPADKSIKNEDVFFDAFEYLPTPPDVTVEDVTVKDVSNDEDNEICNLRSASCNCAPGKGEQRMEPLEPIGISFSTYLSRARADPYSDITFSFVLRIANANFY